jgi:carbonic anhydrase
MFNNQMTRRRALLGLGRAAMGLIGCSFLSKGQADDSGPEKYPVSAEEALQRLLAGNQLFVEGNTLHPHTNAGWRGRLRADQHPFATVLGCSDSRVPPELLFDQGFGDLFVMRVAGNVMSQDVLGSFEYAFAHLHTPLFLVMGHERCGAVTAAVEALAQKSKEPPAIVNLLKLIEPGLNDLAPTLKGEARLKAAVEANVRWSMKQLTELPEGMEALADKQFKLVGGIYDLEPGKLRVLPYRFDRK